MLRKARTYITLGALAIPLLAVAAAQLASPSRGRGDECLSWRPEVRTVFVDAYLGGYNSGRSDACMAADDLFELDKAVQNIEDTVVQRCKRRAKSYSRPPDYYVNVINDFYKKYPKYRNIPYVSRAESSVPRI